MPRLRYGSSITDLTIHVQIGWTNQDLAGESAGIGSPTTSSTAWARAARWCRGTNPRSSSQVRVHVGIGRPVDAPWDVAWPSARRPTRAPRPTLRLHPPRPITCLAEPESASLPLLSPQPRRFGPFHGRRPQRIVGNHLAIRRACRRTASSSRIPGIRRSSSPVAEASNSWVDSSDMTRLSQAGAGKARR